MSNRPLSFKRQAIRFSTASLPRSSSSKILSTRSSSEPFRSSSPHSSARNTASDDCKPCALAVTLGISSLSCARSINGFKDLSAHHCDCVGAAARGRHIVSSPPGDVDVITLERFEIGIENFRRRAPPAGFRAESLSALEPPEGRAMRVASWRDGGEPGQRASQFSPLVTASGGPAKHVSVAVDRRFPD